MLTQPHQRYSAECGFRDLMIAEKKVVLTFLLQLLSERGILDRLAFKGGTCLRKMFVGSQGRFSTDLDFTGIERRQCVTGERSGIRQRATTAMRYQKCGRSV